jgi:hypothetical protein
LSGVRWTFGLISPACVGGHWARSSPAGPHCRRPVEGAGNGSACGIRHSGTLAESPAEPHEAQVLHRSRLTRHPRQRHHLFKLPISPSVTLSGLNYRRTSVHTSLPTVFDMSQISEPPVCESYVSCSICGHLRREPPHAGGVIARATLPAFANRATHGCIVCTLICKTAASRSRTWCSVAQDKLIISVRAGHAVNESSKELKVIGYELLRPCLLDEAHRVGNSRPLFATNLYSSLGKTMRYHDYCRYS